MMKGYIMDNVLDNFEQITADINKEARNDIGTASGGARKIGTRFMEVLTHVVMGAEDLLIEADLSLVSNPATSGSKNVRRRHDLSKVHAYEKDVKEAKEAVSKALEIQNEDDFEIAEIALYRAEAGLKTYEEKRTRALARK